MARVQLLNWLTQAFGILGLGAGKISIASLLLALLKGSSWTGHILYLWVVCIALVVGISISCSVLTMVQCSPPAALWDSRVNGSCISPVVMASYGTFTGGNPQPRFLVRAWSDSPSQHITPLSTPVFPSYHPRYFSSLKSHCCRSANCPFCLVSTFCK